MQFRGDDCPVSNVTGSIQGFNAANATNACFTLITMSSKLSPGACRSKPTILPTCVRHILGMVIIKPSYVQNCRLYGSTAVESSARPYGAPCHDSMQETRVRLETFIAVMPNPRRLSSDQTLWEIYTSHHNHRAVRVAVLRRGNE